jgi:hypothetical protein
MKCDELLLAVDDYVDGGGRTAVRQMVQEHVECCRTCQIVINNIRHTIMLCRACEAMPLSAEWHERIRSRMQLRWAAKFPLARPPR